MDARKIGQLIGRLRRERGMTQEELGRAIHVSGKAVSKWETGQGCPDISLLERLARVFSLDLEALLAGALDPREALGGNMKHTLLRLPYLRQSHHRPGGGLRLLLRQKAHRGPAPKGRRGPPGLR